MFFTFAPITLRNPISLVRFSTVKDADPNSPMHAIMIANNEKLMKTLISVCSCSNSRARSWSAKTVDNSIFSHYIFPDRFNLFYYQVRRSFESQSHNARLVRSQQIDKGWWRSIYA